MLVSGELHRIRLNSSKKAALVVLLMVLPMTYWCTIVRRAFLSFDSARLLATCEQTGESMVMVWVRRP